MHLILSSNFSMFQTLPDQSHCYFLSDHDSLQGYMVKKIPFSHPAHVPRILAILRKQAVFNSIISSCVRTSGIQGNYEIIIVIISYYHQTIYIYIFVSLREVLEHFVK